MSKMNSKALIFVVTFPLFLMVSLKVIPEFLFLFITPIQCNSRFIIIITTKIKENINKRHEGYEEKVSRTLFLGII